MRLEVGRSVAWKIGRRFLGRQTHQRVGRGFLGVYGVAARVRRQYFLSRQSYRLGWWGSFDGIVAWGLAFSRTAVDLAGSLHRRRGHAQFWHGARPAGSARWADALIDRAAVPYFQQLDRDQRVVGFNKRQGRGPQSEQREHRMKQYRRNQKRAAKECKQRSEEHT